MIRPFFIRRVASLWLVAALVLASAFAASDRKFSTSEPLRLEIRQLVTLLEQVHYNRDSVRPAGYSEVLTDYMSDLDSQRLFFLGSDKAGFEKRYASSLYYNVHDLGNIEAAYDIFNVYQTRTQARITWIFDELKKDIDLTATEFYRLDRSKSEWPETAADADKLWHQRIKYELITEILSKGSAAKAKDARNITVDGEEQKTTPLSQADLKDELSSEILSKGSPAKAKDARIITVDGKEQKTALLSQADRITQAKDIVRKRYERMLKSIAEIDGPELSEMFLSSIARLYDPHSTYFSANTYEDFGIQMKLKLVGIGALLGVEDDICVVKEIVPGGPADLDKRLKPNDKIIAVAQIGADPVEIIGMKLRKIVDMIRGDKGTQVRLILQPADAVDSSVRKEIVLTRDVVKLNAARAHATIFDVPAPDGKSTAPIGVITLPAFYGGEKGDDSDEPTSASKDVAELLKRLQAQGVKGLVLDLRRNGGGLLSEAIATTGLFIGSGPVVQVKDYESHINVDGENDPHVAYSGPLAVLVDRFSASASEIVAGALQNYGRAIVVGDSSTHGKGTVQTVVEMKNMIPSLMRSAEKSGAAKLTIQKFYLPSGASTQVKGVIPDIVLPSFEDYIPMIGESDLPHALVWDEIPASIFDGKPLAPQVVVPLRENSLRRQAQLEEFSFLRKNIDWFKARQDQKVVSLNLADRQKQKAADDTFDKELKTEKNRLAKNDFPYREVRLVPKPPARIKAAPKDDATPNPDDDGEGDLSTDDDDGVPKVDIHLRETLRVVGDALQLGQDPKFLAGEAAPLTAQASKRG
jgi:carboxyl-terminal processing protease